MHPSRNSALGIMGILPIIAIAALLRAAPLASAESIYAVQTVEEDAEVRVRKRSQTHHESRRPQRRGRRKGGEAHDQRAGLARRESAAAACEFCPGGLGVRPDAPLPAIDGVTCATAVGFAASLPAGLDALCATVRLSEEFCCPPPPGPAIPGGSARGPGGLAAAGAIAGLAEPAAEEDPDSLNASKSSKSKSSKSKSSKDSKAGAGTASKASSDHGTKASKVFSKAEKVQSGDDGAESSKSAKFSKKGGGYDAS